VSALAPFFVPDGDGFVATVSTRGPWSPTHQHGGPPPDDPFKGDGGRSGGAGGGAAY